ncbi:MAG: UvrD-helicase domain-containing protein [bacterium]
MTPEALTSQIVFAPAGSGKTERLSWRYIQLLKAGVPPERILTLTFTEKAAAEMKQRILDNARRRCPEIYPVLRDNILRLRISTIHSFCFSLVRRFADLIGLDPRLDVLTDPDNLWLQTKYETLMTIAGNNQGTSAYNDLIHSLTTEHTPIWDNLSTFLDKLFKKRTSIIRGSLISLEKILDQLPTLVEQLRNHPVGSAKIPQYQQLLLKNFEPGSIHHVYKLLERYSNIFATKNGTPRMQPASQEERKWNELMVKYHSLIKVAWENYRFNRLLNLFTNHFLATYQAAKKKLGQVDYNDMEFLAYQLLTEHPECFNILYAFDEHTDHLLVDEFQDTSFIQWAIIDKLTEEWRSGEGIKNARNITPTIFIVGDDKQSIYMFRDARVEVFATARDKLGDFLGPEKLKELKLEDNYRSLQTIIDFNNHLFARLMQAPADAPPYQTRYAGFIRKRKNDHPGRVEIILDEFQGNRDEYRQRNAEIVACRIYSLLTAGYEVYVGQEDGTEKPRPCEYRDIAILIRDRKSLPALEKALRQKEIPFIVVGGTGFYEEKEVRYSLALASFLTDPGDDLSLYLTLRGPFFNIPEPELALALLKTSGNFLWERLQRLSGEEGELVRAVATLNRWLNRVNYEPLSLLIEEALTEQKLYQTFWEPQRLANINKLLRIIQEAEASGQHPLRITSLLNRSLEKRDEAKADVPTAGMNAVQIMTVHAAKGLQFPIVFHPGLEEPVLPSYRNGDELLIEETATDPVRVLISYIPDKKIRNTDPLFQNHRTKEIEEEKRIFYVACTRPRDALFLTGIWNDKRIQNTTRLFWLKEHLNITKQEDNFVIGCEIPSVFCIHARNLHPEPPPTIKPALRSTQKTTPSIKTELVEPIPPPRMRSVTRNIPRDFHRHTGEYIALGECIHRLLELISLGKLTPDEHSLNQEIQRLFRLNGIPKKNHQKFTREIKNQLRQLQNSPIWEIIQPRKDALTEMPIVFNDGKTVWTGRIDRIIITPDEVRIYDYKTFPIKKAEIPSLTEEYHTGQLIHYARACQELYPDKVVKTFLIFTHLTLLVPTN